MKEFADDNFKFDENGRKLSERVENTVGKGEIARYEQFILFPQCFQKVSLCGNGLTLYPTAKIWTCPNGKDFFAYDKVKVFNRQNVFSRVESIEGKGENAGNQHFLLFPHCFQ